MSTKVKIGLFGYGCVGQGLHDVLDNSKGFKSTIEKIAVKDRNKKRRLPAEKFTFEKDEILENKDINLVVELIDNAHDAYNIVTTSLLAGKNVVSANKKLIAEKFEELVNLQKKTGNSLLYEASVCGGIPIIRTLEEYYDNELLTSVEGIFNGSSNYILSKIFNDGLGYETALKQAQDLGFAESDPTLDVGGYDSKYKAVILAGHSYGVFADPEKVLNFGIQNISDKDIEFAKQQGKKIKLVAKIGKSNEEEIFITVLPEFVAPENHLYNVENEFNAVRVEAAFSDAQFFIGKGAGGHPTGSAVLSDISANSFEYKYEYKKANQKESFKFSNELQVKVYLRLGEKKLEKPLFFESIEEQNDQFIIGNVSIEELLNNKEKIEQSGAFIATLGTVESNEINKNDYKLNELELV